MTFPVLIENSGKKSAWIRSQSNPCIDSSSRDCDRLNLSNLADSTVKSIESSQVRVAWHGAVMLLLLRDYATFDYAK